MMQAVFSLQTPSFFFSKRKSEKSPLSKLKPQELESLGLKAVGKGADPAELQDAFAKAQVMLCVMIRIYPIYEYVAVAQQYHLSSTPLPRTVSPNISNR